MTRLTIEVTPDALADLLGDLAPEQLAHVLTALANRIEVRVRMSLSEPVLHDWLAEPDLYGDDRDEGVRCTVPHGS
ncbi:MAG TPA: hypothetical protein VJA45_14305, partial [Methylomirabilota bacterium]|nr:hypothetical protein [Methylomirabilota bacterium]